MRSAATPAGVSDTRRSSDLTSVGIPTFMQMVLRLRATGRSLAPAFDDTVHGGRLAIGADATEDAIDAQQSSVARLIDARAGANWNLTRLTPLRFMSIEVIAIGLAPSGRKTRTAHDFRRSHGDPAGAQIFERARMGRD